MLPTTQYIGIVALAAKGVQHTIGQLPIGLIVYLDALDMAIVILEAFDEHLHLLGVLHILMGDGSSVSAVEGVEQVAILVYVVEILVGPNNIIVVFFLNFLVDLLKLWLWVLLLVTRLNLGPALMVLIDDFDLNGLSRDHLDAQILFLNQIHIVLEFLDAIKYEIY